jgi:hypothetical protein
MYPVRLDQAVALAAGSRERLQVRLLEEGGELPRCDAQAARDLRDTDKALGVELEELRVT